jgi:ankyrin repeat protein
MDESKYSQEEANQFIIDCHTDLETVREKVGRTPEFVNAYNSQTIESALGAAGHMARRDIAEFLLKHGAKLELATAAMLGMREEVAEWLEKDKELAKSGGAHNIPVAFHAAAGGDLAIMEMLWDAGAEDQVKNALFGAVAYNQPEMARWLLERGAQPEGKSPDGRTPLEFAEARGYDEVAELLRNAS